MADNTESLSQVWAETVDKVKDQMSNRSLWETMEQAVAITIEDDTLILGLASRNYNNAGHLNISENRNAIEKTASQLTGRKLKMRVIEGDTFEDWIFTKK